MKIISQPDIKTWKYQHTCRHCAAVLEVEANDLEYNYWAGDQREPSYETFGAECPICNEEFEVPSKSVSAAVKHDAIKRAKRFHDER